MTRLSEKETLSSPSDAPPRGVDLELEDGLIVRADIIASIIERSRNLDTLAAPVTTKRISRTNATFLDRLFAPQDLRGWRRFRRSFPDAFGLVEFSAPGYDISGTLAAVYVSFTRGYLDGVGAFVALAKHDGSWHVAWSRGLWVS